MRTWLLFVACWFGISASAGAGGDEKQWAALHKEVARLVGFREPLAKDPKRTTEFLRQKYVGRTAESVSAEFEAIRMGREFRRRLIKGRESKLVCTTSLVTDTVERYVTFIFEFNEAGIITAAGWTQGENNLVPAK